MSAQSQRLNTVASNLANADSATSANGTPYKQAGGVQRTQTNSPNASGVKVLKVIEDAHRLKWCTTPSTR